MPGDAGNQITAWSIVSLLAGTIISATVSYLLQRSSFAEARKQKAQEKFETRKTLGLNLFHKMIRIASMLGILRSSLDEAFARAKADRDDDGSGRDAHDADEPPCRSPPSIPCITPRAIPSSGSPCASAGAPVARTIPAAVANKMIFLSVTTSC